MGGSLGLIMAANATNDGVIGSDGAFIIGFSLGAVSGGIIGSLVGSSKQNFYINGDKTSYQRQKEKLNSIWYSRVEFQHTYWLYLI